MPLQSATWEPDKQMPVGKGATVEQFFTTFGDDRFEISVAPWGEGQLRVNGKEIARTAEAKDRRRAFAALKQAAERYARGEPLGQPKNGKARLIPAVKAKPLEGKKGLVVGIANEHSIAWGCAAAFRAFGADLTITYLTESEKARHPICAGSGFPIVMPLGVRIPGQMEAVFDRVRERVGQAGLPCALDCVCAPGPLRGRVVDVPLEGSLGTLQVSCLDIPSDGPTCRAVDEKGRHLFRR